MTVWVTHDSGGHNYLPAADYGRLDQLWAGLVPTTLSPGQLYDIIADKLAGSSPDDWLLLSGSPELIGLAMLAFTRRHGRLRYLVWDRQERRYQPRTAAII